MHCSTGLNYTKHSDPVLHHMAQANVAHLEWVRQQGLPKGSNASFQQSGSSPVRPLQESYCPSPESFNVPLVVTAVQCGISQAKIVAILCALVEVSSQFCKHPTHPCFISGHCCIFPNSRWPRWL